VLPSIFLFSHGCRPLEDADKSWSVSFWYVISFINRFSLLVANYFHHIAQVAMSFSFDILLPSVFTLPALDQRYYQPRIRTEHRSRCALPVFLSLICLIAARRPLHIACDTALTYERRAAGSLAPAACHIHSNMNFLIETVFCDMYQHLLHVACV